MKKNIFFLVAAAAAMTACTQTDVIEESVQSNVIGFQKVVGKSSRALTNDNLNNFRVYGYYTAPGQEATAVSVFNNEPVVKGDDGKWATTTTRYWVDKATYYFYAYSCDNKAVSSPNGTPAMNLGSTSIDGRALVINNFVCNDDHQHDLVYAYNDDGIKGQLSGNAAVPLKFEHILSKLNVVFESGFPAGYDIEVSGVKIVGLKDKGNFNSKKTPVWGSQTMTKDETFVGIEVKEDADVCTAKNGEVEAVDVTTGEVYVIPCNYGDETVKLEFEVKVTKGDLEVVNRVLSGEWSPNWVAGHSYTYNVTISGNEAGLEVITFVTDATMDLDNWTEGSTSDVEMTFSAN